MRKKRNRTTIPLTFDQQIEPVQLLYWNKFSHVSLTQEPADNKNDPGPRSQAKTGIQKTLGSPKEIATDKPCCFSRYGGKQHLKNLD